MKTQFKDLPKQDQSAIESFAYDNAQEPIIQDIIGAKPTLDIDHNDTYVEDGDVYYATEYEWVKAGYFHDEDDYEDDVYAPKAFKKLGTLEEIRKEYNMLNQEIDKKNPQDELFDIIMKCSETLITGLEDFKKATKKFEFWQKHWYILPFSIIFREVALAKMKAVNKRLEKNHKVLKQAKKKYDKAQ